MFFWMEKGTAAGLRSVIWVGWNIWFLIYVVQALPGALITGKQLVTFSLSLDAPQYYFVTPHTHF